MKHVFFYSANSALVGLRAAALGRLAMLPGVRVPPYFCVLAQEGPGESVAEIAAGYRMLGRCCGEADPLVSVRLAKVGITKGRAPLIKVRGLTALFEAIGRLQKSASWDEGDNRAAAPVFGACFPVGVPVIVQGTVDEPVAFGIVSTAPRAAIAIYAVPSLRLPGLGAATAWVFDLTTCTLDQQRGDRCGRAPLDADLILELVMQVRCIGGQFADRWNIQVLELEFTVDRRGAIFYTHVRPEATGHSNRASAG